MRTQDIFHLPFQIVEAGPDLILGLNRNFKALEQAMYHLQMYEKLKGRPLNDIVEENQTIWDDAGNTRGYIVEYGQRKVFRQEEEPIPVIDAYEWDLWLKYEEGLPVWRQLRRSGEGVYEWVEMANRGEGPAEYDLITTVGLDAGVITTGVLEASRVYVGSGTTFGDGYDPLTKLVAGDMGSLAWENVVELAKLGTTVIDGGFLKTSLINVGAIVIGDLSGATTVINNADAGASHAGTSHAPSSADKTHTIITGGLVTTGRIELQNSSNVTGAGICGAGSSATDSRFWAGNTYANRNTAPFRVTHEGGTVMGANAESPYSGTVLNTAFRGVYVPEQFTSSPWDGIINRGAAGSDVAARWKFAHGDYIRQNSANFQVYFGASMRFGVNNAGDGSFAGDLSVTGALSKGSGTFLIDHPLDPENKDLNHGFVESPRYDLIYRGRVKLKRGTAQVDIDNASNMTAGTFEALTQNAEVTSLCNQTGFARVRPNPIAGGKFTIVCEDNTCTDEIVWVVMAERADAFIKEGKGTFTDADGRLVPEQLKKIYVPEEEGEEGKPQKAGTKGFPRHDKELKEKARKEVEHASTL